MADHPIATHGLVQVGVRTRNANGTWRDEGLMFAAIEWKLDKGSVGYRIVDMIDRAVDAASEAARQATYAAGPKGRLP
jgi:hypothetical protein